MTRTRPDSLEKRPLRRGVATVEYVVLLPLLLLLLILVGFADLQSLTSTYVSGVILLVVYLATRIVSDFVRSH